MFWIILLFWVLLPLAVYLDANDEVAPEKPAAPEYAQRDNKGNIISF